MTLTGKQLTGFTGSQHYSRSNKDLVFIAYASKLKWYVILGLALRSMHSKIREKGLVSTDSIHTCA